jgi:hypothetical protein
MVARRGRAGNRLIKGGDGFVQPGQRGGFGLFDGNFHGAACGVEELCDEHRQFPMVVAEGVFVWIVPR